MLCQLEGKHKSYHMHGPSWCGIAAVVWQSRQQGVWRACWWPWRRRQALPSTAPDTRRTLSTNPHQHPHAQRTRSSPHPPPHAHTPQTRINTEQHTGQHMASLHKPLYLTASGSVATALCTWHHRVPDAATRAKTAVPGTHDAD